MSNRCNFLYLEAEFKKYLIAGNAEASTVKNYISDLHYFLSWVQNEIHRADFDYSELEEVFTHASLVQFYEYINSQIHSPNTTIRRIATLRKFFTFCVEQRWIHTNPSVDLSLKSKDDEKRELINVYKRVLLEKKLNNSDIDRQINVIKDLIINFNLL